MDYFYLFWKNGTLSDVPLKPTFDETILPIAMEDYSKDPYYQAYTTDHDSNPTTLQELSHIAHEKQQFHKHRNKLFSKEKAGVGLGVGLEPIVTETPISKSSFLFSTYSPHLYNGRKHISYIVDSPLHSFCMQAKENEVPTFSNGHAQPESN